MKKILLALMFTVGVSAADGHGELLVKNNDTIAWVGDDLAVRGNAGFEEFISAIDDGLILADEKITTLTMMVVACKGAKSSAMSRQVDIALKQKPAWVALLCGLNDRGPRGVTVEEYQKNMAVAIDRSTSAGARVLLLTVPASAGNDAAAAHAYNTALRALAAEKQIPLADLAAAFEKFPHQSPPLSLTRDGAHWNTEGSVLAAKCVLRALGVNDSAPVNPAMKFGKLSR